MWNIDALQLCVDRANRTGLERLASDHCSERWSYWTLEHSIWRDDCL